MSDLIKREDAIKVLYKYSFVSKDVIEKEINAIPSADRPQGEWIVKDGAFYCSCCGNDSAGLSEDDVYVYDVPLPNYCQHCGAHMKGADDE